MPVTKRMVSRHHWALALFSMIIFACGNSNEGDDDAGNPGADGNTEVPNGDAGVPGIDGGITPDASTSDGAPLPDAAPVPLEVCAPGGDYTTIAAAIAAADPGSTILVCPGTYQERLEIDKRLLLRSTDGAAVTILDGVGGGSTLSVLSVSGEGVTVAGFTIRNGSATVMGGGVHCANSNLHLLDSAVDSNRAPSGGGLSSTQCGLDLQRTRFVNNSASANGGGALVEDSTGEILDASFENNSAGSGGGGIAIFEGSVRLRASTLSSNTAFRGGALYHASDAAVEDNTFANNSSTWTGGGVYVWQHEPALSGNIVSGNSAPNDGGGIYFHQSFGSFTNNIVSNNWSGDDGGGVRSFESGLRIEQNQVHDNVAVDGGGGFRISHWPCEIYDNDIRDNSAGGAGGGLDLDNDSSFVSGGVISGNIAGRGGGIHASTFPYFGATFQDILISDNEAWLGAGIQLEDNFQTITMRGLTVINNRAGHGGGIYIGTTPFTLTHSIIAANSSSNEGGGILVGGSVDPWTDDCPCPPTEATGTVDFSVIHNNAAVAGAGLWVRSPDLAVTNSIWFANSGTTVTAAQGSSATWDYNDTLPATFAGMSNPTGSSGNVAVDPLFVDSAGGDYQLSSASPCADAGDPAILDEDGSRADMGLFGGPAVLP